MYTGMLALAMGLLALRWVTVLPPAWLLLALLVRALKGGTQGGSGYSVA